MDSKLRPTFATPQENKPPRKQIMEGIYGSYRHKKISHSTKEVTEKMACLRRFERPTPALGGRCSIQLSYENIYKILAPNVIKCNILQEM